MAKIKLNKQILIRLNRYPLQLRSHLVVHSENSYPETILLLSITGDDEP